MLNPMDALIKDSRKAIADAAFRAPAGQVEALLMDKIACLNADLVRARNRPEIGQKQTLLRSIAELRVITEQLTCLHALYANDSDALRWYTMNAIRDAASLPPDDGCAPLPMWVDV